MNEMPNSKPCRKDLLMQIGHASFAVDDVKLYLDTHPRDQEALDFFYEYNKSMKDEDKVLIKKFYSIKDIDTKKIFKIFLWQLSNKEKEDFYKIFNNEHIEIVSSESDGIDITLKNVSKGNAVKILANYYNLSLDNIAVFGDNDNDISMLNVTKNSFAMGNATEEVKNIANFVIDSNNEDGVAKAIKKYILKI